MIPSQRILRKEKTTPLFRLELAHIPIAIKNKEVGNQNTPI